MNFETVTTRGIARILVVAVMFAYCCVTEIAQAQVPQTSDSQQTHPAVATPSEPSGAQPSSADPSSPPSQTPQQNAPTGIVDPSAGPLAPVPSDQRQLPSAASTSRQNETTQPSQQTEPGQQPVGTAGAQTGPTAGGAASKPAGNAIAPAKQRQTRSFLIKMGAVAAAAVAIGTVVALSRGTSSNPPGAH